MQSDYLSSDITLLPGIGPVTAKLLAEELHIRTFRDLLYTYPFKHIDRSRVYAISELSEGQAFVQVRGQILSMETQGEGRKLRLVAHFSDGRSVMDLVWFRNIRMMQKILRQRVTYIAFGRPNEFNHRMNMVHPEMNIADGKGNVGGLQPCYVCTEKMKRRGLSSRSVERCVARVLSLITEPLPETLPASLASSLHLMSRDAALRKIHFPASEAELQKATFRLKFEELFYIQISLLAYAHGRERQSGLVFRKVGPFLREFYQTKLPFSLTNAQKRVVHELWKDLKSGRQMNRLLQGDVGSGKTLVALLCILIALGNGYQTSIVAPTEILAEQHFSTFRRMLIGMPVRVELLTSNVKGKRRQEVAEGLADGSVHILVGTHAVMEESVVFKNLGLVVIDEQHRFGVEQRARLWKKNSTAPHVLVMTATPIPRTLAMTLYGDLDVSVIDELPPGRKPVRTIHFYEAHRAELYASMRAQIARGHQIYEVFPLISESETLPLQNLEDGYERLCRDLPDIRIGFVHGRMTPAEKDAAMQDFIAGETQILVSTTVIEVGVDVPNATMMVIESAERFGLAQLHQLRGRVGRGSEQSYCILVTPYNLSPLTRKRIDIMTQTNDGFAIAETDLKLRGPGDLEGTQQSGLAFSLRLANIARDGQIIQLARASAADILRSDPQCSKPENAMIWQQLDKMKSQTINWGIIS